MRSPRRFGAALASVGVGRVELLARGGWHPPPPASAGTRVIVVGSTGGRVGKSTVAAHLAVAFANLGAHVIAVDLDLRTPSLHGMLGVQRPTLGWQGLLSEEIQNLDSSLTSTAVRNLHLVAGGTRQGLGRLGATTLDGDQRRLLMRQLRALEADVIVIDLCAANHDDLADFFSLAETGLLVTSPEESSLAASLPFSTHAARTPSAAAGEAARGFAGQAGRQPDVYRRTHRDRACVLAPGARATGDRSAGRRLRARAGSPDADRALDARTVARYRPRPERAHVLAMAEYLLHDESPAVPSIDAPSAAGESGPSPDAGVPLMSQLDRYRRKYLRYEVDWAATLRIGAREIAVRVVDLSVSGAALEVATELEIGSVGTLCFVQLPGQPALPVTLRSLQESIRRVGVAFTGPDEERQRLVAIAEAQPEPEPAPVAADDAPAPAPRLAASDEAP